ncbi:MAG: recombination-associated protein RdgC [bacterium]|nr:recombination-associated protein RdgC [bacterium]
MFFRNLQIYQISVAKLRLIQEKMESMLLAHAFQPCTSMDMISSGWISPCDNGKFVHHVDRQLLLRFETEKKLLPASVITHFTKMKACEIEEEQGFKPGRKHMKELKERVTDELLPRAFSLTGSVLVWIDSVNGWLIFNTSSPTKSDEIIKMFLKSFNDIGLESVRVKISPQQAMTSWLLGNEAPKGFTIDQDTELKAHTEDKATVRYVRHSLDADDVHRHIAAGKECTKLALTWNDRISFVLTDTLAIKSIKPLDILSGEADAQPRDEGERFDADFILMAGELSKMLDDLFFALGGLILEDSDEKAA